MNDALWAAAGAVPVTNTWCYCLWERTYFPLFDWGEHTGCHYLSSPVLAQLFCSYYAICGKYINICWSQMKFSSLCGHLNCTVGVKERQEQSKLWYFVLVFGLPLLLCSHLLWSKWKCDSREHSVRPCLYTNKHNTHNAQTHTHTGSDSAGKCPWDMTKNRRSAYCSSPFWLQAVI